MRFIYWMLVLLLILIILSYQAHAAPQIIYFYDGDTVKIKDQSKVYKLRINHIDAPERNQAYGKKSRRALMQLCLNKPITVTITGTDHYQRQLGELYCDHKNASEFMLKNGYAWYTEKYSNQQALAKFEHQAKSKQIGLWQSNKAVSPWVWRKLHANNQNLSPISLQKNDKND